MVVQSRECAHFRQDDILVRPASGSLALPVAIPGEPNVCQFHRLESSGQLWTGAPLRPRPGHPHQITQVSKLVNYDIVQTKSSKLRNYQIIKSDLKIFGYFKNVQYSRMVFVMFPRDGYGDSMVRTPGYEPCTWFTETGLLLESRIMKPAFSSVAPFEVLPNNGVQHNGDDDLPTTKANGNTSMYPPFPSLNGAVLSTAPNSSRSVDLEYGDMVNMVFSFATSSSHV